MSGEIKLAGMASGIAFDELIAKMIEAEKYQANKLETWKKTWQTKVDTLKELASRVSSLQSSNNILKSAASFITKMASTTNASVADITVDSSTMIGNYKMEVAGAVKHKTGSTGVEAGDQGLQYNSGDVLELKVGANAPITIDLENIDDVDELIAEINAALQGSGASAELVSDGSQSNPYRIVITAGVAGSAGQIQILHDDTGLSFDKGSMDTTFENVGSTDITSILSPAGTYNGHNSKQLIFTIDTGGQVADGKVRIKWEDPTDGKSGYVSVSGAGTVSLPQGLKINVLDGNLVKGTQFTLDVYAPDIQLGQDRGLAQSAQVTHAGMNSRTSIVTTTDATFQYSYRGQSSTVISVPAGTTLEGLVKIINEAAGNPGVRASIINDGGGTGQSFHLVLTGVDSGAANQIEVKSTTLTNMHAEDFTTTRKATNAILKVDDFPPGADNWIQKNSNLITDIVSGASIRLKDTGTVNFTIANNEEDMADKVQAFVDEYNALMDYIDEITKIVIDENDEAVYGSSGVLTGNYAVNILRSQLRTFVGSRGLGFSPDNDAYSLLTQIGLTSNDFKRIDFDRDLFTQELIANPNAIVSLFSADKEGMLNNNEFIYIAGTSETKAGIYDFTVNYNSNGDIDYVSYRDKATGILYTSNNRDEIRIAADKKSFTVFGGNARGVAIQGVGAGGSNTFSLTIKDGKSKSFNEELERLFNDKTGITKVLERNYESIIKNIDKRIDRENQRLLQVKKRLEMRFANLEVNMQNWNGQMERLQQQMQQLPSASK